MFLQRDLNDFHMSIEDHSKLAIQYTGQHQYKEDSILTAVKDVHRLKMNQLAKIFKYNGCDSSNIPCKSFFIFRN